MNKKRLFIVNKPAFGRQLRGQHQALLAESACKSMAIMSIVGLDLAGVETRPTGFCILNGMKAQTCDLYSDKDIIQETLKAHPIVILIDAPLSLPPGRTSLEERTGNHLRDSDRALMKMGIKIFPVTLGPMRKLTLRGIKMRQTFEALGYRVLEAYPGGAQDVLGIPRKSRGVEKLYAGLVALGLEGLKPGSSDHELDAATIAYVGKLYLEGKTVIYGDPKLGIVMPKKDE
jgi:predicted nuclease with RNAse H fold